jgi:transporter family protein
MRGAPSEAVNSLGGNAMMNQPPDLLTRAVHGTHDPSRLWRRHCIVVASGWFYWAVLSAAFAALTAIFAKIGIQGVDSDLATLIRTAIIIVVLAAFVAATGKWANPFELSRKTWVFLGLSGLATGASWVCYFRALKLGDASQVAPVDKFSLVLVAVFAFVFLGERPSLRDWSGIAMVAAGVLLLAFKR